MGRRILSRDIEALVCTELVITIRFALTPDRLGSSPSTRSWRTHTLGVGVSLEERVDYTVNSVVTVASARRRRRSNTLAFAVARAIALARTSTRWASFCVPITLARPTCCAS